jgi:hypothetical protein
MKRTLRRSPPVSRAWLVVILAGAIAIIGYFGPWAPHRAAGLVILGGDLAEYVKFLPEVASGQVAVRREVFYLPLLSASLGASLLASRPRLPGWLRAALAISAVPTALALLPPAWSLATLRQAEFRLQMLALLVCLAAALAHPALRRVSDTVALGLTGLLMLAACALPAWSYLRVQPFIAAVYRSSLPLGWGFWACLIGHALSAMGAAAAVRAEAERTAVILSGSAPDLSQRRDTGEESPY